MKDQYDQLEKLMKEKSFTELSPTERIWVKQYISVNEYEAQRHVLTVVQQELNQTPLPPKQLESQLMHAFRKQHSVVRFSSVKLRKSLLWAATIAAVFFIGRWSHVSSNDDIQSSKIAFHTIYKLQRDTIYIEKTLPLPLPIHTKTIIRDTIYINHPIDVPIAKNTTELMPILEIGDLKQQSSNVNDDQEIYNILVDVY